MKQRHKELLGLQGRQELQALLELKVLQVLPAHKDPPEPTLLFLDQQELRAQLDHKVIPERKEPPEQQDHKVIPGRKVRRGLPDRKERLERWGLRELQAPPAQLDLVGLQALPAQPVRVYRLGGLRGRCWLRLQVGTLIRRGLRQVADRQFLLAYYRLMTSRVRQIMTST